MKNNYLLLLVAFLFTTLACGATGSVPPTATTAPEIIPSFTPIATLTPAAAANPPATPMLSQTVSVQSTPVSESSNAPLYTLTAQIPVLQGSGDSRVGTFNTLLDQIAQGEIAHFKNDVLTSQSNPPLASGSSFDLGYTVVGQRGDIWSIKFDISFYADGAAHPAHYSTTITYDLSNGREISLDELFLSSSDYLQVISDLCKAQLSARDIGPDIFQAGADPLPENYQRWNISNDGLVITFDEYQVAPYAAGPQVVTIPFADLQSIVNPQGIIGWFTQ